MKDVVKIFKALGDENRLKILHIIGTQEICACKLLEYLEIGQPTLSHHMKILCDSGIVSSRKDGKWTLYKINKDTIKHTADYMQVTLFGNTAVQSCCNGC